MLIYRGFILFSAAMILIFFSPLMRQQLIWNDRRTEQIRGIERISIEFRGIVHYALAGSYMLMLIPSIQSYIANIIICLLAMSFSGSNITIMFYFGYALFVLLSAVCFYLFQRIFENRDAAHFLFSSSHSTRERYTQYPSLPSSNTKNINIEHIILSSGSKPQTQSRLSNRPVVDSNSSSRAKNGEHILQSEERVIMQGSQRQSIGPNVDSRRVSLTGTPIRRSGNN